MCKQREIKKTTTTCGRWSRRYSTANIWIVRSWPITKQYESVVIWTELSKNSCVVTAGKIHIWTTRGKLELESVSVYRIIIQYNSGPMLMNFLSYLHTEAGIRTRDLSRDFSTILPTPAIVEIIHLKWFWKSEITLNKTFSTVWKEEESFVKMTKEKLVTNLACKFLLQSIF